MALTVTPDSTLIGMGRPVGGSRSTVETINDSTSTANPPTTTTYTEPGLTMRSYAITFDSSYATGGESLTAADLGLSSIVDVICTPAVKSDTSDAYITEYDNTAHKLMAYKDSATAIAFAEVSNGVDLSAYTCHLLVIGHP